MGDISPEKECLNNDWCFDSLSESLNRRKILAVSTQLKQFRKESLKKVQARTGFEPMTSAIPVQYSIPTDLSSQLGAGHIVSS